MGERFELGGRFSMALTGLKRMMLSEREVVVLTMNQWSLSRYWVQRPRELHLLKVLSASLTNSVMGWWVNHLRLVSCLNAALH